MTPYLEVLGVRGLTTVQDMGRPGYMHHGIPPGGALVPALALRANDAVENPPDTPLLEIFGGVTVALRGAGLRLSLEDGAAREVALGEALSVEPSPALRVRYLAVAGGLAVPRVLGGRGTLHVARIGGHEGRPLQRGDRIPVACASAPGPPASRASWDGAAVAIRVVAGPEPRRFSPGARVALTSSSFVVLAESDRAGTRLSGARLPRTDGDASLSAPMVRGAIQVPASEQPVVLGPDHPTTGGYPVIAVVARVDLGRLFASPVGGAVRFTEVTLDEARGLAWT